MALMRIWQMLIEHFIDMQSEKQKRLKGGADGSF